MRAGRKPIFETSPYLPLLFVPRYSVLAPARLLGPPNESHWPTGTTREAMPLSSPAFLPTSPKKGIHAGNCLPRNRTRGNLILCPSSPRVLLPVSRKVDTFPFAVAVSCARLRCLYHFSTNSPTFLYPATATPTGTGESRRE